MEYNVYNFDQQEPDVMLYDISACYLNRKRRRFAFKIPGKSNTYLPNYYGWIVNLEILTKEKLACCSLIIIISETIYSPYVG